MPERSSATKVFCFVALVLAFGIALSFFSFMDEASARRGGDDDRLRFYGIIESRPVNGLHGQWVVGGRAVTTHPGTEFDQAEGALLVGNCAKVDIRNGRVHEIDSEPFHDCR